MLHTLVSGCTDFNEGLWYYKRTKENLYYGFTIVWISALDVHFIGVFAISLYSPIFVLQAVYIVALVVMAGLRI